jgi:hypothetical protein
VKRASSQNFAETSVRNFLRNKNIPENTIKLIFDTLQMDDDDVCLFYYCLFLFCFPEKRVKKIIFCSENFVSIFYRSMEIRFIERRKNKQKNKVHLLGKNYVTDNHAKKKSKNGN